MAQAKLNDVAAKNETRTAAYQAKTTLHDDSAKQLKEILDVRTAPPAGICFFCVQSIARLRSKVAQFEHAQITRSRVAATQKKQKELSRFGLPIWRQTATRTGRFTHGYDHSYAPPQV